MQLLRFPINIIIFSLLLSSSALYAEKFPVEYFASLPDVDQVKVSPSGRYISYLVRVQQDGVEGVALSYLDLQSGKSEDITFASNKRFVVRRVLWANDKELLVSAVFPSNRRGIETKETRLLVFDIKTKKGRNALPKRFLRDFSYVPLVQDNIIDLMPEDENNFLLEIGGLVYRVSLKKNKVYLVQDEKKYVRDWMTDRQHNVRLGIHRREKKFKIIHRPKGENEWSTLWEFDAFSADSIWPMGFDDDSNLLYVRALHEGRAAVFLVDLSDPTLKKQLVYAHPRYDVDGYLIYSQVSKKVVGITSNSNYLFWDEDYKALYGGINAALKNRDNFFSSFSADENTYVAFSTSDIDSGTYYVGNRANKSLQVFSGRYNNLPPEKMSPKKYITYKARDGLDISAFVSLPIDRKESEALPTVVFPHGGPISYDGRGFDYWTQFFVSRGYAVIQMNFRGSSGYGHDFMKAGLKNWGLQMQDDVEDGARWMVENGYSDPNKICIVGASYGGYAALMGAIKSPEIYKCAVSFAGVTDIAHLVKSSRNYSNYEIVKEQIGKDLSELRKRSPLHSAEKINVPALLIHGSKDRVVEVEHGRKMNKALKKHGKDVQYIELKDGNHYLSNSENRLATFKAMDKFLQTHLNN